MERTNRKVARSIRVSIRPSSAGLALPRGMPEGAGPAPEGCEHTATKNLLLIQQRSPARQPSYSLDLGRRRDDTPLVDDRHLLLGELADGLEVPDRGPLRERLDLVRDDGPEALALGDDRLLVDDAELAERDDCRREQVR